MLKKVLLYSLSISSASCEEESNVIKVNHETYSDIIAKHQNVLMSATASWCGHCKQMKPEFEKAARELKDKTNDVVLANVDCTEGDNKLKLCAKLGMMSYPTIFWHKEGVKIEQYNGRRTASDF